MGNMYDNSDLIGQMFKTKDRNAETLRRLQMQDLEEKIEERKRTRKYEGGLADHLRTNEWRTRDRTEQRVIPGDSQSDIEGKAFAGEMGGVPMAPVDPGRTEETRIPGESLAKIAREGALKLGNPKDALQYGKMETEEIDKKSKARTDELKVQMDFQKEFANAIKSGNPSQLEALYSQFEDNPTLGKTIKKIRGLNIELSGPDEFTTVMDIKEKTVKNPIDGTFVPAGTYKVKQKNGKVISAEPVEGKKKMDLKKAGYGQMINEMTGEVIKVPEKPDKPEKSGGEDGNAKMAQVGKIEKVIVNVNQGFLDLASKNPDNKDVAEDLRSGTVKNIRPYLNKGQQAAYDVIMERAQVNTRTMEPAQAYQEALRWYKSETQSKGGGGAIPQKVEQQAPPSKAAAKTENKSAMNTMPPARQHGGKTIRDTTTGVRYKSNGLKWVEIK